MLEQFEPIKGAESCLPRLHQDMLGVTAPAMYVTADRCLKVSCYCINIIGYAVCAWEL